VINDFRTDPLRPGFWWASTTTPAPALGAMRLNFSGPVLESLDGKR
jgi:hypothetical protein